MKFIITESQYRYLFEDEVKNEGPDDNTDYLSILCNKSTQESSPACRLKGMRHSLDDNLKKILNKSIRSLYRFFGHRHSGVLPTILHLALHYEDRTISTLNTIAKFIDDDDFKDEPLKKELNKLRYADEIPDDLEEILKNVREKQYSKYENSFVGKYFDLKRTGLSLKYKCEEQTTDKFIDIVDKFKQTSDKTEFEEELKKIKSCITESLSDPNPEKTDVVSLKPLYVINENGKKELLFKEGSKFEIKMMDTNIDSYLSEFFSIFKQSELSHMKASHLETYNHIINKIFEWMNKTEIGEPFLGKLTDNLSGLIYDNYTIIPSKYIQFYWSNLGQRGCGEKRLSIRFRINPDLMGTTIPAYIFNRESDILEKKLIKVPQKDTSKIVC